LSKHYSEGVNKSNISTISNEPILPAMSKLYSDHLVNGGTVYGQTNGTLDNQTMRATNGTSGTTANGTSMDILSNALQQQQQSQPTLQSPPPLQQQPLPPPITQPLPQQPFTSMPPTIPISIVLGAATNPNP
jgi:hypothetical protein